VKRKRPPLFCAYVHEGGVRRRLTQRELRECWRLWTRHSDIRLGKTKPEQWGGLPRDEAWPR
jgi:hypothetical protein